MYSAYFEIRSAIFFWVVKPCAVVNSYRHFSKMLVTTWQRRQEPGENTGQKTGHSRQRCCVLCKMRHAKINALWRGVLIVQFQIRDTIIHGRIYTGTGFVTVLPFSLSLLCTGSLCSPVTNGTFICCFLCFHPPFFFHLLDYSRSCLYIDLFYLILFFSFIFLSFCPAVPREHCLRTCRWLSFWDVAPCSLVKVY
jgi:hypothetical protein